MYQNYKYSSIRVQILLVWFLMYGHQYSFSQVITTISGNYSVGPGFSGDGGPAVSAVYNLPIDIKFDNSGNLLVLDQLNQRVRKIDFTTNNISTIAGNGNTSFSGDGGPATAASFSDPQGIAIDKLGNIYVADMNNSRIRRIDA